MTSLPTPLFPYPPFIPSPATSFQYFVRSEPVDALQQPFQPFHMALQTTVLNPGATAIFEKLKNRSALHIKLLAEDVEGLRALEFEPKNDKESVLRDVGVLLQLSSKMAGSLLGVVKGPEDKLGKVKNADLKKLVAKLREKKSEHYVKMVENKWKEIDTRKSAAGTEGMTYFKDLGLLMQFSVEQHCALVGKLLCMIQKGEIQEDATEVLMGRKSFEFYYLAQAGGKWSVVSDPCTSKKRKAEDEVEAHGGDQHVQKKNRMMMKKRESEIHGRKRHDFVRKYIPKKYVPRVGEWKCNKCGWYSVGGWCSRMDRFGGAICIGRRETSLKDVGGSV
ncbi:hypothetical protein GMOD_00000762 [Pyrenophora seminiperda CCB06]|uniref:Uncharacterized protein n=1 Tax=Pyrenophora seminiperda CCB06 TaxID=1302712 RepID=A0A3M7M8C4_9PLEO|nr:hypothetical protein GMOD_00000762 [Pyrenophora seminiperda CCB06]